MELANRTWTDFIEIGSFDRSRFWLVFDSGARGNELGNGFWGSFVFTPLIMMLGMVFLSYPLKVIRSVICFVSVLVMHILSLCRVIDPTYRNDSVHQPLASNTKIPVTPYGRGVWREIPKNFPAPRNSVQVIEEPIFGSVNLNAKHGGSFQGNSRDQSLTHH